MKNLDIVLAGFGGQGDPICREGLRYAGLIDKKEISWLPSYGPEMRRHGKLQRLHLRYADWFPW